MTVKVTWRGKEVAEKVREAGLRGLDDAVEFLLEQSNRTIPLDEGTLMRSGVASVDEGSMTGAVSYSTKYAVRVHEDTRARHNKGRRAKWLERTYKEHRKDLIQRIRKQMKDALR